MINYVRDHWMILVLSALWISQIQSCGPLRPLEKVKEVDPIQIQDSVPVNRFSEAEVEISRELGLRLVTEGDLPAPDPGARYQDEKIFFSNVIHLPNAKSKKRFKRKELLLVWPEEVLGSKIIQSSVSHRILNSENQELINLNPTLAIHDQENKCWYFPISRFFQDSPHYQNSPVTEAESQIALIDLTLQDGTQHWVEVRFRAKGKILK